MNSWKKTPVGLIPSDWHIASVESWGQVVTGSTPSPKESAFWGNEIPFVTPSEVQGTHPIVETERKLTLAGGGQSRLLPTGSVVFVCIGSTIGKVGILGSTAATNQQINGVSVNNPAASPFVKQALEYRAKAIARLAGKQAVPIINKTEFSQVVFPSPPEHEAVLVGNMITKWDVAVHLISQVISQRKRHRAGLMQQLLTGKRRFPGFTKPWRKLTIGDVAEECTVRNQGRLGQDAVRAVNKAEGMIPMKEHVMADDLSRYQVVRQHWFAYNPMRINIGSICQWVQRDEALVSPDYVVFRCRDEIIDHRYFNAFRRSHRWSSFMESAGAGGVRIRIYFTDLALMPIPLPDLEEQRRIADLFDLVDREISTLELLLAAYQAQKKGLMQQLLTGKRRVKVQAA